MKRINIVCICVSVLSVLLSCNSYERKIKNIVSNVMGTVIDVSLSSMEKRFPKICESHDEHTNKTYTMVTYIDSSACSPCGIDHLFEWDQLIKETKEKKCDVSYIFIVAPKKTQVDETYYAISHCSLNNEIYVDKSYIFRDKNPCMSKGYIFGSFLLDENNKVILVGNPLDNPNIQELFMNIIRPK